MKRLLIAAYCVTGVLACSGGAPEAPREGLRPSASSRPSILLITLDTTRADHLEPYGDADADTPALAHLAEQGVVFDNAVATAPVTAPAHASLLTGLYPPRHGLRNNLTHHLPNDVQTLAERLASSGYRTAAFVSAVVLERRYGLDQGFEVYDDDIRSTAASREMRMVMERRAEDTTDRALAWLDTLQAGEPYFLWVHYYDPHLPYVPPPPWSESFADRPYDGEIAYMDSQIARLLNNPLVASGDAVVAAIGDHGEGLGEHGEEAHGLLVYDSTIHVPWILRLPGGPSGVRIESPISQVDLVPTIIDYLALEPDPENTQGRSLLPLLAGSDTGDERLLFSESEVPFFSYGWSRLRSVRQGEWKLIDAPAPELYDLSRDPGEESNLAADRPEDVRRLTAAVDAWWVEGGESGDSVAVDSQTEDQLRALGYLAGDPGRPAGKGRGNPIDLLPVHEKLQEVGRLLALGQPREAVVAVQEALAKDPENLAALRDLSRGLVQLGRLDEAAEAAAKATAVAPWSAQALTVEAEVEHRRGNDQRALELIDRALELDDRLLEAHLDRSMYLSELGKTEEAAAELSPLLEESPDNNWVLLRYAEAVDLPSGDLAAAENRLRTVVSQNPFIAEAWLLLGTVLKRAGRLSDAAAVYRDALAQGAVSPDITARLALLLADAGDPQAEAALREAIRSSPAARSDLYVKLGDLLAAQGRTREAREQYELAAETHAFSAGTRNAKAMALMRLGRTDEAEKIWKSLINDQPDHAGAWLNLSSLSIVRRQWSDVERYARMAVENEPTSSAAWNNLGIGLDELGRPKEAEAAYREASEVDPRDWRALFNLGILLRKTSRFAEAEAVQKEVLARAPGHTGAHFELGMLYAGPLGDNERAKIHLQATIDADPDGPRGRQARTVLDQIQ